MATEHQSVLENLVAATHDKSSLTPDVEKVIFEATVHVLESLHAEAKLLQLAVHALTNMTDDEERCRTLLTHYPQLGALCVKELMRAPSVEKARDTFGLLTNLTRHAFWAENVANLPKDQFNIDEMLGRSVDGWLVATLPLVLNLAQTASIRRALCQPETDWVAEILVFLDQNQPLDTRRLAAGIIKNICFEDDCHPHLISDSSDLLSAVLRSLVSSSSDLELELDNEDIEDLPVNVQKVLRDPKHEREADEQVRLRLLKALLQLCSTPIGREALQYANTYVVLRELYKWEGEHGSRAVLVEARHVIDVLITEAEPKKSEVVPDYDSSACFRNVDVPADQMEVVERLDRDLLSG